MSKEGIAVRRLMMAVTNLDKIYVAAAPKIGRQSSELWLMYVLDDGKPHSQKQICDEWGFPRTTLNTITKKCETAGYLTMTPIRGKRREMQICLTESGKKYAKQLLSTIYRAEKKVMKETVEKYSANFIEALEYFADRLRLSFEEETK